jgi:anti-anti-sigma regulatory factor
LTHLSPGYAGVRTRKGGEPMAVTCAVGSDGRGLLVAMTGELMLTDVAVLRVRLLKCLAEQPEALLIDLSALTVTEPLALSVFTAVVHQAARWPGTPVLLCAPGPQTRALLAGGAYDRLPLFATTQEARKHLGVAQQSLPTLSDELLPISGAAQQARSVAAEACQRWDLPHLTAPACLITSELVSNVVDHANTIMTLRLSLRQRFLHIAVRDGSTVEPTLQREIPANAEGGRGIFLVDATAHSWGCLPTEGGKVVWASLAR